MNLQFLVPAEALAKAGGMMNTLQTHPTPLLASLGASRG